MAELGGLVHRTASRNFYRHGDHEHASRFELNRCRKLVSDPRQVGDLCYSGYWRTFSLILRVERNIYNTLKITELNLGKVDREDGVGRNNPPSLQEVSSKEHMTAWDWRRDRLVGHGLHVVTPGFEWSSFEEYLAELRDIAAHAVLD